MTKRFVTQDHWLELYARRGLNDVDHPCVPIPNAISLSVCSSWSLQRDDDNDKTHENICVEPNTHIKHDKIIATA